ncbi:Rmf/CrpP fold protein [Streptomyces spectabilis]|uniref:Rmf/CrpP fold protein n=1 Tax=Streptomyces spectabilis TaxID=68270 RepID=UPI0033F1AEC5
MGTRKDIIVAIAAGREAGARGESPTACPYPRESLLRTAWIRGYALVRPLPPQTYSARK